MTTTLDIMHDEATAYAAWLNAHGYEASVWHFSTVLNDYEPANREAEYATGYAVRYAGQLIRDDGSRAGYPTAGITVFCHDGQLPLGKLVSAGRALVTFDNETYTAYYVSHYNPRESSIQQDQSVNPGTLQYTGLRIMTPLTGGDGPKLFYDLRLSPAGQLQPEG